VIPARESPNLESHRRPPLQLTDPCILSQARQERETIIGGQTGHNFIALLVFIFCLAGEEAGGGTPADIQNARNYVPRRIV